MQIILIFLNPEKQKIQQEKQQKINDFNSKIDLKKRRKIKRKKKKHLEKEIKLNKKIF